MTTKNVLYVVAGLMFLMGAWALGVTYVSFPELGFTANVWVAAVEVLVGGYGLYVAFSDKA